MNNAVARPIFWGTSWPSYTGDEITGMDTWYAGFGGSNYAATSNEYTGTNNTKVTSSVSSLPSIVDGSAASGGQRVSPILAEVCKVITNPASNGYYAVYTDLPRGHAGYCAWHSYGTCGSTPVQIAFFWKLDGDAGCDPQASSGLGGHSQGLLAASGDIVAFVDDDCLPEKEWLSAMTRGFHDPKIMAAGGRIVAPEGDEESPRDPGRSPRPQDLSGGQRRSSARASRPPQDRT